MTNIEPSTPCPTNWRTSDRCHIFVLTGTHRCVLRVPHNSPVCMCACGLEPGMEYEHRCSTS